MGVLGTGDGARRHVAAGQEASRRWRSRLRPVISGQCLLAGWLAGSQRREMCQEVEDLECMTKASSIPEMRFAAALALAFIREVLL